MNDCELIWESYLNKILLENDGITDLTSDYVNKLKHDYEVLIKNINNKLTPENASKLKNAFDISADDYDNKTTLIYKWGDKKREDTEYVRIPMWNLHINLGRMQNILGEYSKNKDESSLKKLINLKKSTTKIANDVWNKLNLFISNNPNMDLKLNPEQYVLKLEGIPFTFIGLTEKNKSRLPRLKYYVNKYIERAKKVAPLMIKYSLPVEIHMEFDTHDSGDAAGLYYFNKIILTAWASKREDERSFVKTLAHEMGHHIYKSLSENSRQFWYDFIISDKIEIDVEEIINMMHENELPRHFENRMKNENPMLYIQAETLFHTNNSMNVYDLQSLIDAYKENRIPKSVVVPNTPITGYAAKNSEEAFCEALGMYVAYGNRAVPEKIKNILNVILAPSEKFRLGESTILHKKVD